MNNYKINNQNLTLDFLKRKAKKLKKETGIVHIEALNIVAKEEGYENWQHLSNSHK